jgi:cell division control protein 45
MYLPRGLISHLYTHLLRTHHPLSAPVLILAALEPDALCACRILSALLKRDYIPHKIQPVSGYADLSKAGNELIKPMKTTEGGPGGVVVCMGVGGLIDLGELLGLEGDTPEQEAIGGVEVWVIDARRPWNLNNVFGGLPTRHVLGELDINVRRNEPGIDKGCIQKSYRPGNGGIIVFDDGDIANELDAERDAYCALAEMPDVEEVGDEDSDEDEDKENDTDDTGHNKKRKSWSDQENEELDSDDERPRQRRRSNSGFSISSPTRRDQHTPSSSRSNSPISKGASPKIPSAKVLRRRLLTLRRSHEAVLDQYYTLGTSYSEPISSLLYSLASELGREDNDLLWLAIVGVSSLELSGHTSTGLGTSSTVPSLPHQYHQSWQKTRSSRIYALLRDEVRRLNPVPLDSSPSMSPSSNSTSPTDTSIRLSPDPRFVLLRHWSLYDSMLHSPYLASRLHIWNESGVKRLHKLLAKMGISLSQCKQGYTHMDMDLKKSLREKLLKYAGVYGLDDLVPSGTGRAAYEQEGWGFVRSWGWKAQLSALDVGVIVGAILEVGPSHPVASAGDLHQQDTTSQRTDANEVEDRSETLLPRFFCAYDALAPTHPTQLLNSIPLAQHLLKAILRTGTSLLAKHQIRHLRAFRMGVVKEGPDLGLFSSSPGALVKLALWVGEAVAVSERDKKGSDGAVPLVLAALDEARGTYVVVGTGGGMGSGPDTRARKEKSETQKKRQEEKAERRKAREERREAKAAERAARQLDGEEEEEEEEESDDSSDDDDDDEGEDAELQAKMQKRGYGRNRFGLAFQEVAEETNARVKIDTFDHSVIEVKKEDLPVLLEKLSLKSVVGR